MRTTTTDAPAPLEGYIVIGAYQFEITYPYRAGHVLTEIEANTLNYIRGELMQKIAIRWVQKAEKEHPNGLLPCQITTELQHRVDELDLSYKLPHRSLPRPSALDRELSAVARALLRKQGVQDPEDWQLREAKANPEVQNRARQLLESRIHELL